MEGSAGDQAVLEAIVLNQTILHIINWLVGCKTHAKTTDLLITHH